MNDSTVDMRATGGSSGDSDHKLRSIIAHRGGLVLATGYVLIGVGIAVVISNLVG